MKGLTVEEQQLMQTIQDAQGHLVLGYDEVRKVGDLVTPNYRSATGLKPMPVMRIIAEATEEEFARQCLGFRGCYPGKTYPMYYKAIAE